MRFLNFRRLRETERIEAGLGEFFKLMNAYIPSYATFEGGLYEMELTRAAIHSFATHVSKLKPEVRGSGNKKLERLLQYRPNPLMDTKKYLYRLATVYAVDNTAFIAPLEDRGGNVIGFYPLATSKCRIIKVDGVPYLQYEWGDGRRSAVELERAGILTQMQYDSELFGSSNACMLPTMQLLAAQNQGIIEGVKNGASIRFLAKLAQSLKPKDLTEERERFTKENLSADNNNGVLVFDQKYEDIKQIQSTPYSVPDAQARMIRENVYDYFGTNEKILRNEYSSNEWNAYYEGKIEPVAIELSLVHTHMAFTDHEIAFGNEIIFTSNRLQYLTNAEKLNTVTQLFDRGFLTHNQGLEIFNLPPIEGGDKCYIRKEYGLAKNYNMEGSGEDAFLQGTGISFDDAGDSESNNDANAAV